MFELQKVPKKNVKLEKWITGGTIGMGLGTIYLTKRKSGEYAEMLIKGYKKKFGISHDKAFDQTLTENEAEYAAQFEKELNHLGYKNKTEELMKSPNKWLFAACYFKVAETKTTKRKMQFINFLLNFNTAFLSTT